MWYLALGLLLLVASLWLPFATARRAMRVEARANDVARALMEAVGDTVDALDANDVDTVLARFFGLAARDGIYVEDLERVDPAWPGTLLSLRNKHYLFQLAESPPDPKESPGAETVPAYEVMAWPRRALGPANSVFFHPDNAVPAYTRNLAQGYAGAEDGRPRPGCAQRRQALFEWTSSYRGDDDERWIAHLTRAPG